MTKSLGYVLFRLSCIFGCFYYDKNSLSCRCFVQSYVFPHLKALFIRILQKPRNYSCNSWFTFSADGSLTIVGQPNPTILDSVLPPAQQFLDKSKCWTKCLIRNKLNPTSFPTKMLGQHRGSND